jgi:hypothetical protein
MRITTPIAQQKLFEMLLVEFIYYQLISLLGTSLDLNSVTCSVIAMSSCPHEKMLTGALSSITNGYGPFTPLMAKPFTVWFMPNI